MLAAFRLAIGLLTAFDVGAVPTPDRHRIGLALLLAPLTTLPVVVVTVTAGVVASATAVSGWLLAVPVIITGVLLSRAMHLDGLADTTDGLSAGFDPERSLRAMKASDVGPSGVVALVLVLLLQAAALAVLLTGPAWAVAAAALGWPVSRLGLALACRRGVPAATDSGLGAMVAGTVSTVGSAIAVAAAVVVGTLIVVLSGGPWWPGPVMVGAAALITTLLVRVARRRLGGITGDVLGAIVETSLTAAWVGAAVAVGVSV